MHRAIPAQPAPPRARITPDLRLDSKTENFGAIADLYVGPRGQIVLPIYPEHRLRIYDSTGKRLESIGRDGGAPGEFRTIFNAGWLGDTLWVNDGSLRRMSYFASNGRLIRTEKLPVLTTATPTGVGVPQGSSLFRLFILEALPNGAVGGTGILRLPNKDNTMQFGDVVFARIAADGRSHVHLVIPDNNSDERYRMTVAGFGHDIPLTVAPRTIFSWKQNRMVRMATELTSANAGTITIVARTTAGDTLFKRAIPYQAERISQSARDSAIAAILGGRDVLPEDPPNLRQQLQAEARRKIPATYPGAELLLLGLDGSVWVGLRRTAEGRPTLVLNPQGEPVATVVIPRRSQLRQATMTHIWVSEFGVDERSSIVRYRISGMR